MNIESPKPLAVSPNVAMSMLSVGRTRLYELINDHEIDSYHEGKARRITVASIEMYVFRRLNAAKAA